MYKCKKRIENIKELMDLDEEELVLASREYCIPGDYIEGEPIKLREFPSRELFYNLNSADAIIYNIE